MRNEWTDSPRAGMCAGLFLVVLMCGAFPEQLRGGGGPENLAVVVNADSWVSQTIANEYLHLRGIPAVNVVYLRDLRDWETIDVESFRQQILLPVLKTLYDRDVFSHIDCIAYSADIPTAVNVKSDFEDVELEQYQTPVAAINGLTYLYQLVLAKRPEYLQLDVNYYLRRPVADVCSIPATREGQIAWRQGLQLMAAGQWERAAELLRTLAAGAPDGAELHFQLSRCLARLNQPEEALAALQSAVQAGWADRKLAEADNDLAALHELPVFRELLEVMERNADRPYDVQPTTAFRSQYRWNVRGEHVNDVGPQYMLSTVLAVTGGQGNSIAEARAALRRGVAADGSCPPGTIYYMENGDVRARTRQPGFRSAVAALEKTGVAGRVLAGAMPEDKSDVAGAMLGSPKFDWQQSHSTIVPGAICEHLTSFGGALQEGKSQTPLSEFLRYGAAGSSGTVTEPYSIAAKFPSPFLHVHYARGCCLAEAYYQSVSGPYQLLIVGDPLCQPWARSLHFTVDQPQPMARVSGMLTVTPQWVGDSADGTQADHFEAFVDGLSIDADIQDETIEIDTHALGDGWHELAIVAVAAGPLEIRSRAVIPVLVDNGTGGVEIERLDGTSREVSYEETLSVRVRARVAAVIDIINHGRVVGTLHGPEGTLDIAARDLGLGPARLQATTRLAGKPVYSAPLELQVVEPSPRPALASVQQELLEPGIMVSFGGLARHVIQETRTATWLASLDAKPGTELTLQGYYCVDSAELHQLQFRGNAVSEVWIDDESVWRADDTAHGAVAWVSLPLRLEPGWHCLRAAGTITDTPRLAMRFGYRGCQSLDGQRFFHTKR